MSTHIEREQRLDDFKNKITTLKKEMRDLEHELYKMSEENDFPEFMSTRNNDDNIQINNIERVVISDFCLQSYPCQHDCEIYYKDGSMEEIRRTGRYIAQTYFDILNDDDKMHFYIYLKCK